MDILTPINSIDSIPKERVDFDEKTLSQMTLPEHARLLNELAEFDSEEFTEEEQKYVDKLNLSTEKKIMAVGYIIKKTQEAKDLLKVEEDYYKQKIKDIQTRSKILQNRVDSRLKFVSEMMNKIGKKKLEGANFSVKFRKLPNKVEFTNEEIKAGDYPELHTVVPESVKWDRRAIKEFLKTNESNDFKMSDDQFKLEVK